MAPAKHAKLAPSASHRWLECTPSAMLESSKPSFSSPFAKEGTEAHRLAEIKLRHALGYTTPDEYTNEFEEFRLTSEFYNAEFNDYVNDYVAEVMAIVHEDYIGQEVTVYLEQYVTFEDIVPYGGGTSDVVVVGKDFIHIIDLKFGKGVPVSAIGNPQLRLYALGAVKGHVRDCQCRVVRMTIIQPRLNDKSTDEMPIVELNDWALNYVKPRAELAIAGKGSLVPGDHCKFCKCRGECQALADQQLTVAQAEFEDAVVENNMLEPANMSPDVLSRVLTIAPKFIDWFKDVQAYAVQAMIQDGAQIPGFKVVEGRSNRQIIDPEGLEKKLREAGYTEDQIMKPREMLGITALEKNIGKKVFGNLSTQYVVKPTGKLTIASEDDRRPAIDINLLKLNGQEFFTDEETDDQ